MARFAYDVPGCQHLVIVLRCLFAKQRNLLYWAGKIMSTNCTLFRMYKTSLVWLPDLMPFFTSTVLLRMFLLVPCYKCLYLAIFMILYIPFYWASVLSFCPSVLCYPSLFQCTLLSIFVPVSLLFIPVSNLFKFVIFFRKVVNCCIILES